MVKKEKGKMRNNSKSQADCGYLHNFFKKAQRVIHWPVCLTRKWQNTLPRRGKKRSDKLPCQISAIKFARNSAAINFCARRSWSKASMKHLLAICACSQILECEDCAD